jgi:hypothetical protein
MRRHINAVSAALVALSTITLAGCGPDDGTSTSSSQNNASADNASSSQSLMQASQQANPQAALQATPQAVPQLATQSATPTTPPYGASAALGSNAPDAASESAVQSVEASLAADSQQVPPVMHFAPGDSDQNSSRN